MPLYSLITLHTSLIFPHSRLLCWGTCLGGKSISENPVNRRWDLMLDIIMWFESLSTKMFFHAGEELKVRRCQIQAVGQVLKNLPAPSFQKIRRRMSFMQSGIVMQQQHPHVWHLRPLALNSSFKFFESGLISSRIVCFIRRRKVQQKHTMHVPKHSRRQFPRAGWCLEFFDGGRPWMFPCHGLRFCLRTVLVHPSFITSNDVLQDILSMIINAEEMTEGCTRTVFPGVLYQLTRDPPVAHFSVP